MLRCSAQGCGELEDVCGVKRGAALQKPSEVSVGAGGWTWGRTLPEVKMQDRDVVPCRVRLVKDVFGTAGDTRGLCDFARPGLGEDGRPPRGRGGIGHHHDAVCLVMSGFTESGEDQAKGRVEEDEVGTDAVA